MNICFHTWRRFGSCRQSIQKLCNVSQKQYRYLNPPKPKFPENSLIFYCFLKIPEELGKFPEISLIFHEKAISLSFPESVGTLKRDPGHYISLQNSHAWFQQCKILWCLIVSIWIEEKWYIHWIWIMNKEFCWNRFQLMHVVKAQRHFWNLKHMAHFFIISFCSV